MRLPLSISTQYGDLGNALRYFTSPKFIATSLVVAGEIFYNDVKLITILKSEAK